MNQNQALHQRRGDASHHCTLRQMIYPPVTNRILVILVPMIPKVSQTIPGCTPLLALFVGPYESIAIAIKSAPTLRIYGWYGCSMILMGGTSPKVPEGPAPHAAASVRWIPPVVAKYSPWVPAARQWMCYKDLLIPKTEAAFLLPWHGYLSRKSNLRVALKCSSSRAWEKKFSLGLGPNSSSVCNPSFFTNPTDDWFLAWKYWWYSNSRVWVIFAVVVCCCCCCCCWCCGSGSGT